MSALSAFIGFLKGAVSTAVFALVGIPFLLFYWLTIFLANVGKAERRLSPCMIQALQPFYPAVNLNEVVIVRNAVLLSTRAMVFVHTIYIKDDFNDADHVTDLPLLLHELEHVQQYEILTTPVFLMGYAYWTIMAGGVHDANPFEMLADLKRDAIKDPFFERLEVECSVPAPPPEGEEDDWAWMFSHA